MDKIPKEEAGARLKAARIAAGLTQAEMAERLGLHQPNIAEMERGDKIPSWTRLVWIVRTLGFDPRQIVPEFFAEKIRKKSREGA